MDVVDRACAGHAHCDTFTRELSFILSSSHLPDNLVFTRGYRKPHVRGIIRNRTILSCKLMLINQSINLFCSTNSTIGHNKTSIQMQSWNIIIKLLTYCVFRSTQPPTPAGRGISSSLTTGWRLIGAAVYLCAAPRPAGPTVRHRGQWMAA